MADDCAHPKEVQHGGDWEIYSGRLGDLLLECRGEKRIAVDTYNKAAELIKGDEDA